MPRGDFRGWRGLPLKPGALELLDLLDGSAAAGHRHVVRMPRSASPGRTG